jgi:hypothetical protein
VFSSIHAAFPGAYPPAFPGLFRNASAYMHWPPPRQPAVPSPNPASAAAAAAQASARPLQQRIHSDSEALPSSHSSSGSSSGGGSVGNGSGILPVLPILLPNPRYAHMCTGGGSGRSSDSSEARRVADLCTQQRRQYVAYDGMRHLEACSAGPCDGGSAGRSGAHSAWGTGADSGADTVSGWDWLQLNGGLSASDEPVIWCPLMLRRVGLSGGQQQQQGCSVKGVPCLTFSIPPKQYAVAADYPVRRRGP